MKNLSPEQKEQFGLIRAGLLTAKQCLDDMKWTDEQCASQTLGEHLNAFYHLLDSASGRLETVKDAARNS